MRLSASINFFNSEETVEAVVENIRPCVDHLSVVYQERSNWGASISRDARRILEKFQTDDRIDDLVSFVPDRHLAPHENEFRKRNIGYQLAKKNNATHFRLMDADEFYFYHELESAKKKIELFGITHSAVKSFFYLKSSKYRSKDPDTTNVCFICKISDQLRFDLSGFFPIENVDPTRRLFQPNGNFLFFDEKEIVMHHMCFVRRSFLSKMNNTSSRRQVSFIADAWRVLDLWKYPDNFLFPGKPKYEIICVPDFFNLSKIKFKKTPLLRFVKTKLWWLQSALSDLIGTLKHKLAILFGR